MSPKYASADAVLHRDILALFDELQYAADRCPITDYDRYAQWREDYAMHSRGIPRVQEEAA